MKKVYIVIGILILIIICSLATKGIAQVFYPYPFLGINPYLPIVPPVFPPPVFPPVPYITPPLPAFVTPPAPPLLPRVGAATIIITNPTAGTVSIINPTVAAAPTVAPTAVAAPTPLLSILAPLYASLLYNSPLSTANPLLNALLQTIFI